MKYRRALGAFLTLLALSIAPLAVSNIEDRYLCIPEKTTGFYYDKSTNDWGLDTVEDSMRYVVERSTDASYVFQVSRIGKGSPEAFCLSTMSQAGYLVCTGIDAVFSFDTHSGRYVRSSVLEYFKSLPDLSRLVTRQNGPIKISVGECLPVPPP